MTLSVSLEFITLCGQLGASACVIVEQSGRHHRHGSYHSNFCNDVILFFDFRNPTQVSVMDLRQRNEHDRWATKSAENNISISSSGEVGDTPFSGH